MVEIIIRPKGSYTRCTTVLGTVEEIQDMLMEIFKLDQHAVNLSEHQLVDLAIKKWNNMMYTTNHIAILKLKYSKVTKHIRLVAYIREDYNDLKYLFGIIIPPNLEGGEIDKQITSQFKVLAEVTGDGVYGTLTWCIRQVCRNSDFYVITGMLIFLLITSYMQLQ